MIGIEEIGQRKAVGEFNWNLWFLKWSAILVGGSILIAAPFVIHAKKTRKPGTVWAR